MRRPCKILLTLILLAGIFLVPALVLFLVFSALCWVWLWEGSALQILLALLLWFCGSWALALTLGPRRAKTSPL